MECDMKDDGIVFWIGVVTVGEPIGWMKMDLHASAIEDAVDGYLSVEKIRTAVGIESAGRMDDDRPSIDSRKMIARELLMLPDLTKKSFRNPVGLPCSPLFVHIAPPLKVVT